MMWKEVAQVRGVSTSRVVLGLIVALHSAMVPGPTRAQDSVRPNGLTAGLPELNQLSVEKASTPLEGPSLRADAGDDQIGLVGRQITLNASRSEPKAKIGFRWIQVGGPPITSKAEDRYIFSFTPKVTGVYKFALVVAASNAISEPDFVDVLVGTLDQAANGTSAATQPPPSIEEYLRATLPTIPGGPESAESLAKTFEGLADRMELFENYGEIYSELSRRLDTFIPQDPSMRALWIQKLFSPLTMSMVDHMRAVGLDMTRADAQILPLTAPQKNRFGEFYRLAAKSCRSTQHAK